MDHRGRKAYSIQKVTMSLAWPIVGTIMHAHACAFPKAQPVYPLFAYNQIMHGRWGSLRSFSGNVNAGHHEKLTCIARRFMHVGNWETAKVGSM